MSLKQWERYLFHEHNLVALPFFNNRMKLFDVLVKKGKEGGHPILSQIGNLATTRSDADVPEEWEKVAARIRGFRKGSEEDEEGLIERQVEFDIVLEADERSNVMMKALKLLSLGGGASHSMFVEACNVTTESICHDLKEELFLQQPALWIPDLRRIALELPAPSKNGLVELWVIIEMKFCSQLKIHFKRSTDASADLELPPVVSTCPIPIQGGISVTKESGNKFVLDGTKIPFGFKAIRLAYDCDGKLVHVNKGQEARPIVRAKDEETIDPDECPAYHMGDLFLNEDTQFLECLDIEYMQDIV